MYVPKFKLAIEYHGEQHYKPVNFGGISNKRAKENLLNSHNRDMIKEYKIKEHRKDIKTFIIFTYKHKPTEEFVKQTLIDYKIMKEWHDED